jgi:hypothetical protein
MVWIRVIAVTLIVSWAGCRLNLRTGKVTAAPASEVVAPVAAGAGAAASHQQSPPRPDAP